LKFTSSPVDVTFRRMDFSLDSSKLPKYWYAESPSLTHFFNALSAVFPEGEKYFIDSVRAFESAVRDPRLTAQVREFTRQEGHHNLHHRHFNRLVQAMGVSMDRCAEMGMRILERSRRRDSELKQLAMTVAFEHFTALMGDWLLHNAEKHSEDVHPAAAPLWMWHAVEETEHKAVAYDVYQAAGGGYWLRVLAMVRATANFIPRIHHMQVLLLREDPTPVSVRDLLRCAQYLYGRGGLISALLPGYLRYFRPDFHPWQDDNSELIAAWQAKYGQYVAAQAT
jgi:predicted metal-dependent hydrolase